MHPIIEHARGIAEPLSRSLAVLEVLPNAVAPDTARRAIRDAWLTLVDDFQNGRADLSTEYLARVHRTLAVAAQVEAAGGFSDLGSMILRDGNRESWTRFVKECWYDDLSRRADDETDEEYALCQLRWGGHAPTFALSLGWFAMNLVRLWRGQIAVYPPPSDHQRLLEALEGASPETYDAENVRGIAEEYAREQSPEATVTAPHSQRYNGLA